MNKKAMTILASLLLCGTLFAWDGIKFGVKAGLSVNNIPNTTIEPDDEVIPHIGFSAGGLASFEISDMSFLQAELLYSLKGIKTRGYLAGNYYRRDIHYLQLPIVFGFNPGSSGRFSFMAGPQFALALGETIKMDALYDPAISELNKFNLALVLQANYMFLDNLGADIKFDYALTHTFKGADKGRNLSVQLGLCYVFGN